MSNNAIKPLPEDHKFIFSKLNYDAKPNFEPAIKISVFFRKREDITHEEFFKHWQTVHADLTLAVQSFQDNIIRYSQVCVYFRYRHQEDSLPTQIAASSIPSTDLAFSTASSNTRDEGTPYKPGSTSSRLRCMCPTLGKRLG